MSRVAAISAAVAVVALIGGVWYVTARPGATDAFAQCRSGSVAGDIGGPFTLVNGAGETVTDEDVITEPSLIYFGYTFCPDVCPFDVARNVQATEILAEDGLSATPVFISIDPERDTPDVVGDFAANHSERMIGLTGSEEQVRAASQSYRTYYSKQEGDPEYYLVDHSTFTYLVLPEHGFVDYFRREVTPEQMAERTACFIAAS